MCKGYDYIHAECGHLQKFETTEMCSGGFSHSKDSCYDPENILGTVMVRTPARCNDCFNHDVAEIRRNCNGCVEAVQAQISDCDTELDSGCDESRRKVLRDEQFLHREEIEEFKKKRDEDIAALRAKQGV